MAFLLALSVSAVPPGVARDDPDAPFFRTLKDPLRSFEKDNEGWMLIEAGTEARPAERAEGGTHGAWALRVGVEFPHPAVVFKNCGIGRYRYISYDVFVPAGCPGRVGSLLYIKQKDGRWFQVKNPRRLLPGRWNTCVADLRGGEQKTVPVRGGSWTEADASAVTEVGIEIWSDESFRGEILVDNVRGWTVERAPRAPVALNVEKNSSRVGRYELFELTFDLDGEFSNPFDPDEIAVDCFFFPEGSSEGVCIPAFYFQDYLRRRVFGRDELVPRGRPRWKVRFSPRKVGGYECFIETRAGGRRWRSGKMSFRCVESSLPGFARVSKKNPRLFEFEDGSFFFPIGHNVRSPNDPRCAQVLGFELPPDRGTFAYDDYFARMSQAGENFVEVWMSSWWLGLEWTRAWKGYEGLGRYNLENAWKLDYLVQLSRKHGLYIQLVIDNHGKYAARTQCDAEWRNSPYNVRNGGFLNWPEEFFVSEKALKCHKKKLRYIMARWSAYRNIFSFEIVSELDLIGNSRGSSFWRSKQIRSWHGKVARYIRSLDPNRHLITTHYSSDYHKIDPEMAELDVIDYVTCDAYRGGDEPFIGLAMATSAFNKRFRKPFLVTEYGGAWNGTDALGMEADLHAGLWSSFLTEASGTPLLWWFEFIHRRDLYFHYRAFANFVRGEDSRDPEMRTRTGQVDGLKLLAYYSRRGGYAWVYDERAMSKMPEPGTERRFRKKRLTLQNLHGEYAVEFWDTYRGVVTGRTAAKASGRLEVKLPEFTRDIALKFRRK